MLLKAENISKQFFRKSRNANRITVLHEMDFLLPAGKFFVITGRSGSGKSTLLNILAGLLEPTTGKVLAGEEDLYAMDDEAASEFRNENFGFIPQGQSAVGSLNVLENILLPFSLYGDSKKEEENVKELMAEFGILELASVFPAELSGGELRRMAIVRTLAKKPQIIFADEPTGDLDDENTEIVLKHLKKMTECGGSVLMVTHENDAAGYADMIYKMSDGVLEKQSKSIDN